jgi:hypothetical protein
LMAVEAVSEVGDGRWEFGVDGGCPNLLRGALARSGGLQVAPTVPATTDCGGGDYWVRGGGSGRRGPWSGRHAMDMIR